MMNLFATFDMFFWKLIYLILFFIFLNFYNFIFKESSFLKHFIGAGLWLSSQSFYSIKLNMNKMINLVLVSTMTILFLFNFWSISPYFFSLTSQMKMFLMFSISTWLSFNLFKIFNNFKMSLSHFIPLGSPLALSIFLFLIEMVSNFIKPFTLVIRLMANIIAGHLLMMLLAKLVLMFYFIFPMFLVLTFIEMLVAIIQSYIFSTLLALYSSEN